MDHSVLFTRKDERKSSGRYIFWENESIYNKKEWTKESVKVRKKETEIEGNVKKVKKAGIKKERN